MAPPAVVEVDKKLQITITPNHSVCSCLHVIDEAVFDSARYQRARLQITVEHSVQRALEKPLQNLTKNLPLVASSE
jgi:hypothetical protein